MSDFHYQREQVSDLWDEAAPLLEAHWREIAHYQDIPLSPNVTAYRKLEDLGQVRCYTVRAGVNGGKLAGYVVFFVCRNPHYSTSLQASQDVLFVAPEYRQGMAGVRLIRHAEECLRAEGVQVIYHHVKRTNRVGELLERLGYEQVEHIYAKRLDR